MSAFANFWGSCQRRFYVRITAPRAPSHQLEVFESEHGLFNHVIFRFSFRKFFFLSIGNAICFFFRAMNYYGRFGQSRHRGQEGKKNLHAPLAFRFFFGFARLRTYEPSPAVLAHFSSIRIRAYARCTLERRNVSDCVPSL